MGTDTGTYSFRSALYRICTGRYFKIKNAMIIGKGSLFLGRMTNLFDGVSFVIHGNTAAEEKAASGVSEEEVKGLIAKAMKEFAATLMAE